MGNKTGVTLLAARIGIALIFLLSGVGKVAGWSDAVAHAASRGGLLAILGAGPGELSVDARLARREQLRPDARLAA